MSDGFAGFGKPAAVFGGEDAYAVGECGAACFGDAGSDEGVEDFAFGTTKPGHDWDGAGGEELFAFTNAHAPGDGSFGLCLNVTCEPHAECARLFSGLGDLLVVGLVEVFGVKVAGLVFGGGVEDDDDFVVVGVDVRWLCVERRREVGLEPALQFGCVHLGCLCVLG